jgi:replication fork clamp-binding protein CrfC
MVVWWKFSDVTEVLAPSNIRALMMESASTSKTSVKFYQTTRHTIPEDSHLHARRRENLKSHQIFDVFVFHPPQARFHNVGNN